MKRIFPLLVVFALLSGCMYPNFTRLIPENKDANVLVLSPMYGQVIIQTRVNPGGTNPLPALTTTIPVMTIEQPSAKK